MRRIRGRGAVTAIAVLVGLAVGGTTIVGTGGTAEEGTGGEGDPGIPYTDEGSSDLAESGDVTDVIVTGGSTYDETILTKFISASAFVATQGDGSELDKIRSEAGDGICVRPDLNAGGTFAQLRAAVELPDGARIRRIVVYGADTYAPADMLVRLLRATSVTSILAPTPPTRSEDVVTSFTTTGVNGNFALASADNLEEVAGSFGAPSLLNVNHRFHSIYVRMTNAALANHVLCGVEVLYQVPAVAAPTGDVFNVISPIRVYDSRQAAYAPNNVVLGPNQSRIISIKDARDTSGNLVTADAIPTNATAITYNITIASPTGPNFVAVTPGDAASFTASAINFNGTADIANAATVKIAADRTIKVWGGDQAGSMHIIIDVTGYYTAQPAPTFPNMGN